MKVLEVDRIDNDSVEVGSVDDLDKIIELPLLESCKIFYNLGVRTVMSSCNKTDVSSKNIPRRKNFSFYNKVYRDWSFSNGYAWILIDFSSMSSDNQKYLLSLYDDNNYSLVEKLPENAKRAFADLCKLNEATPSNKELIEFVTIPNIHAKMTTPPMMKMYEEIDNRNPRPDDPIYKEFYSKKHPLFTTPYIERGVLLRYPLNEETTVEEVNKYFVELANSLTPQRDNTNGFKITR